MRGARLDWVFILVEALIMALTIGLVFEYDRWRRTHVEQISVLERVSVNFILGTILMIIIYFALHNHVGLGGRTYQAPAMY